jgi:DNA-directed RNA polymerase subunit RPC12/RpoP
MSEAKYYCGKCGTEIKPTDTICPKCGANLSKVGRRIEATLTETIGLSDNKDLATKITGSLVDASNSTSFASSFISAIPKEKREEIGINEEFLKNLKDFNENIMRMAEGYKPPNVTINYGTIIWQTSTQGDNVVVSTNIGETFNKIIEEVEKTDIDSKTKNRAKSIINEVKKEIAKEKRDKSKILKMYDKFKTLVPLVAPLLEAILKKVLFG